MTSINAHAPVSSHALATIEEILADGMPLFATVRDDESGFTSSRAMLVKLPEWDYAVVALQADESTLFGSLEAALEVMERYQDMFVRSSGFTGSVTTQLTHRVHRLDVI